MELVGREEFLRNVSSILMRGDTSSEEGRIKADKRGLNPYRKGYSRIIEPLGNGMAHVAIYHESILPLQGRMSILLGNDDDECFERFKLWLGLQPLPRLADLQREMGYDDGELEKILFKGLIAKRLLCKQRGYSKIAYAIQDYLRNDHFRGLREAVIAIAKPFLENRTKSKPKRARKDAA
jgi:hypothetical protein